MTEKTLQQLQEEHSALCARAIDLKIKVPEDLTVDFDTVEGGNNVVNQLQKLIDNVLAKDSGSEHSAPVRKAKKATAKKASVKPAAGAAKQQEKTKMAKTVKKTTAKKAPAKKAAKKGAVKKARSGNTKVSKVIAGLKSKAGITRAQILKMTGWKAVSVQQLATAAGLKLKVSDERPFVYRAA